MGPKGGKDDVVLAFGRSPLRRRCLREIRVPSLTLATGPTESSANNRGRPANLSGTCLRADPLRLAGYP